MVGVVIDMDGVTNVIPAGEYTVTLSGQKYNDVKNTFRLEFTVADTENPQFNGRKQWRHYSLEKDQLWFLKRDLVALDIDSEIFEKPFNLEEVTQALMGNQAIAVVSVGEYQGEANNNVQRLKPLDV
jgi:hypothetical protein